MGEFLWFVAGVATWTGFVVGFVYLLERLERRLDKEVKL